MFCFGLFLFCFVLFGVGNEGSFPGRTEAFSVVQTHIGISQLVGERKREAKSGITVDISKKHSFFFFEENNLMDLQVVSLYAVF